MKKPLQIGVTGGIGSGKSTVCRIFQMLGAPVYDADSRAKSLMTTDGIVIAAIKKEFGVLSYNPDGLLNREFLAKEVFNDQKKLDLLNSLVHPRVGVDYDNWLSKQVDVNYVIKEAALIFEAGTNRILDKIIVVQAPEELRIRRVLQRDNRSAQQVREIISKQMPEKEKVSFADFVVINDEKQLVIPQVIRLHDAFNMLAVETSGTIS